MSTTPTLTVRIPRKVRRRLEMRAQAARVPLGAYARLVLWDHVDCAAGLKLGAGFKGEAEAHKEAAR
jgi:hypothetical protein